MCGYPSDDSDWWAGPIIYPNQLVWVVALPLPRAHQDWEVNGLLLLLSPAANLELIGEGTLVSDPSKGLSLDEVIAWSSEPMPAELDDAVPGCQDAQYLVTMTLTIARAQSVR